MQWNARNMAAWLLSSYYLIIGKHKRVVRESKQGKFILSVYFHDPTRNQFEKTVLWFKKYGFHFISVDELIEIIEHKKDIPKQAVLLTADDGWMNNKSNIVDVAQKHQVPVTIFVSIEPISTQDAYWWSYIERAHKMGIVSNGVASLKKVQNAERLHQLNLVKSVIPPFREALTIAEVQETDKNTSVKFGSHTISHPILTQCDDDVSRFEIHHSKTELEIWLNRPVYSFAFPNGAYAERELNYLKASGYKIAFNTVPTYLTPQHLNNPFELPRFDVLENVSTAENICRMTGIWFNRKPVKL